MIKNKKTVLTVDDQKLNNFALSAALNNKGYVCTAATSGEQCLNILKGGATFDVILMDMMMPVMDGITTIKFIREMPGFQDIKILMVTADDSPELNRKCIEIGANGLITKPVDVDQLLGLLQVWLS